MEDVLTILEKSQIGWNSNSKANEFTFFTYIQWPVVCV